MKLWTRSLHKLVHAIAYEAGSITAHLSMVQDARRPIGWLHDIFFLGMIDELEAQQVPKKVAADAFGMSLRTYQRRIAQARASQAVGYSLWSTLSSKLKTKATKQTILSWFDASYEAQISSILRDMIAHRWVQQDDQGYYTFEPEQGVWTEEMIEDYAWLELNLRNKRDPERWAHKTGVSRERWEQALERLERAGAFAKYIHSDSDEVQRAVFHLAVHQLFKLFRRPKGGLMGLGIVPLNWDSERLAAIRQELKRLRDEATELGEGVSLRVEGKELAEEFLVWMFSACEVGAEVV